MILSKTATDLQTSLEEYLPLNGGVYDILARLLEQVWDEGVDWGRDQYGDVFQEAGYEEGYANGYSDGSQPAG